MPPPHMQQQLPQQAYVQQMPQQQPLPQFQQQQQQHYQQPQPPHQQGPPASFPPPAMHSNPHQQQPHLYPPHQQQQQHQSQHSPAPLSADAERQLLSALQQLSGSKDSIRSVKQLLLDEVARAAAMKGSGNGDGNGSGSGNGSVNGGSTLSGADVARAVAGVMRHHVEVSCFRRFRITMPVFELALFYIRATVSYQRFCMCVYVFNSRFAAPMSSVGVCTAST